MRLTLLPELALELGVQQANLRRWLDNSYETLPSDLVDRGLSDHIADAAREHFNSAHLFSAREWVLEIGDTVPRVRVHEAYGGQRQSGISTPAGSDNILIFTDPLAGAQYGYDKFEGLHEDGSYSYTGEGQVGDHQFKGGNKAILESSSTGKTLRLFRTNKTLATYVGAFQLDTTPFLQDTIPDVHGNPRLGIIFNLVPISARVGLLPSYGGDSTPFDDGSALGFQESDWTPPDGSAFVYATSGQAATADRVVDRVEFALQTEFGEWLIAQGTPPRRLRLKTESSEIEPDLYVPSEHWIVEAKKSTARGYVRMAIGQVLDYVHIAKKLSIDAKPVILLPGMPEQDLIELLSTLGIDVFVRDNTDFVHLRAG